jgi:hypothetical protein
MPTSPHIPFPADLDALCVAGCLDALSALEVGALYRLVRHAWQQEDPCTLALQDDALAMVARVNSQEWAAMRSRILLAFGLTSALTLVGTQPTPPAAPAGEPTEHARLPQRVTLGHARSVFDRLASASCMRPAARAAPPPELSEARRAAGLAGARSRWQSDGKPHGKNGNLPSAAIEAKSARSSSESSALSLNRSLPAQQNPSALIQSAERQSAQEVIGDLSDGAGAERQLAGKMQEWRAAQSFRLLRSAWEVWVREGLTDAPLAKISELAAGEHATPARVDTLVQHVKDAAARAERSGNSLPNPIGIVIAGLAMQRDASRRGRPCEVSMFEAKKWNDLEEQAARVMRVQVAREAALQSALETRVAQRIESGNRRRSAGGGA